VKLIRYGLATLLCFAAFWGAAHVGVLPIVQGLRPPDVQAGSATESRRTRNLSHLFPVIR
jgi:hypothetical protein